jgi:putative transposase
MADKQRIPHKEVTQVVVSASLAGAVRPHDTAITLRDKGVHAYLKEVMMARKKIDMDEALRVILSSDGDNPFRDMLELIVQTALEVEMSAHLGAESYERNTDRTGYRSGTRSRIFTTRVGDLELLIPQDRDGTFSTALFECFQRSEKALALAMMEMYVQGVSTRKVAAITEELCGRAFSSQQVSKLAKGLDEKAEEWRNRPIEGKYPYLLVDARYEKVRRGGRVISQGVLIAMGISSKGMREILSVVIADTENETTWSDFLRDLKRRGLEGVQLVTSDDHEGIKKAVMRHFQGASWQRCQCHFSKNVQSLATKGQKAELHADLRAIFNALDIETLNRLLDETIGKWSEKRPAVAEKIDEEIVDALACFCFPAPHRKRIRTTNALERLNEEIKRRTRVVRIFPNEASALRLITALAMEQSEDWDRRYLDMSLLSEWAMLDDELARAVWKMIEGLELTGAGAGPTGRSRQQD